MAKMCHLTEIHVQPFQAYFQYGFPIYSSKVVRFRMGHLKVPEELQSETADGSTSSHKLADNKFIWNSPEFPMAQLEYCIVRKTAYKSSSCQSLSFALEESCKLSYWVEFETRNGWFILHMYLPCSSRQTTAFTKIRFTDARFNREVCFLGVTCKGKWCIFLLFSYLHRQVNIERHESLGTNDIECTT